MWISSSPSKNRSDRGRIDVFFRGLNWIFKASLLILALASFSVAAAPSDLPNGCDNLDTCFAKNSKELEGPPRDDIRFDDGEISWNASGTSEIGLYKKDKECQKFSFIMDKPTFAEADKDHTGCKFSMLYNGCEMDIDFMKSSREEVGLTINSKEGGTAKVFLDPSVNVNLEGGNLKCDPGCGPKGAFCDFEKKTKKDGDWCKFDLTLKNTDGCEGKIRFGQDYKLLATQPPTTVAPETSPATDDGYAKTTPDGEAAGLSPWIIAGIVVAVLLLLGIGVGLLVYFLVCRRKRRGSPQNMAEKGNAGSVCLTEMTCPTQTIATQGEASHMKSGSEMVGEPSANERKEVEERSKPASKVEVAKPVSQKKKKDNTYQSLQKEEAKNVPAPSPSPAQENKPKRTLAPDELYEPLGDPDKAIPMHLSEKKISEKKKKKEDPYQRLDLLQKEGAKNAPATPSPSRSSKKKKSEKKKKDDHYHRLESLENEGKK